MRDCFPRSIPRVLNLDLSMVADFTTSAIGLWGYVCAIEAIPNLYLPTPERLS